MIKKINSWLVLIVIVDFLKVYFYVL